MARGKPAEKGAILERQLRALEYRRAGWSYRAIGEKLGVSHVTAYDDVMGELQRLAKERVNNLEELRELELERLDMLLKGLEPMAKVGNPGAVNSFLKVMERRARLLGLDAPTELRVDDWRSQAIADIRMGKISYEALASAFDTSLAAELFAAAGVPVSVGQSTPSLADIDS